MARWFSCPYLGGEVELTDEREAHILARHAELLPGLVGWIRDTLDDPDNHISASYTDRLLFARWYDHLSDGKYVLVVVSLQPINGMRYWIVTAYILGKPVPGEPIWRRS